MALPGLRAVSSPWRLPAAAVSSLIFAVSLAVYLSNGHSIRSGDTVPAGLLPIVVLVDGTVTLDRFADELHGQWSGQDYFLIRTGRGVVSFYPVATGLMAIPVYLVPVLVEGWRGDPTPAQWIDFAPNYEKLAAAIITALSVVAFWRVCRALALGPWLALGLTALYAFGSEAFAISAQALWQHGPGSLAVILSIGAFVGLDRRRAGAGLLLSLCAAVAVAIRLNNVLLVAPLVVLALWRQPRQWPALVLPGAVVVLALAAYNQLYFGLPLGPYQGKTIFRLSGAPAGLAGTLVSPARGLFVYFPAALVALGLLLRHPALLGERLVLALGLGIVATTGLNAGFHAWWGGYGFGPRYFAECEPAILLILGIALTRLSAPARFRASLLCFAVLLPWSVFVQAVGVYLPAARAWDDTPRSVDDAHGRLWDVGDNPILRGLRGAPPSGG
jgi:hypothetical protein